MKILIVDDDKISRIVASKILAKGGYEILEASNAKQAMECLGSAEPIRLLLTDITMPEMDGLELVSWIRGELGIDLPVIMYTSRSDQPTVVKAIKMGIQGYVTKPVTSRILLVRVKEALINDVPPFADIKELRIDEATYRELIVELINTISSGIEEMREAGKQEDFERLVIIADACASGSLSLRAMRMADVLLKLEKAARNKDIHNFQKMLFAIERELNILRDEAPKTEAPKTEKPPLKKTPAKKKAEKKA